MNRVVVYVMSAGLALGCGAKTSPPTAPVVDLGCATSPTPDMVLTLNPPEHHTLPSPASRDYGSPDCPNQYLVEFAIPMGSGLYVSGAWGVGIVQSACDYASTMTAFGEPSGTSSWELVDQVKTHSVLASGVCTVMLDSRLNQLPPGADPTSPDGFVNPDRYDRARVAVRATDGTGANVPVLIDYFYPTP